MLAVVLNPVIPKASAVLWDSLGAASALGALADHGELVQKNDPIYLEPVKSGFFGAQFYAPGKWIFGRRIPTLWANVMVLWGMALLLCAALYAEVFPRLMAWMPKRSRS